MNYSTIIYSTDDLKKYIFDIVEYNYPEIDNIILFGSYARGDDVTSYSDLDLYISEPKQVKAKTVYTLISRLKEVLQKPVDLFRSIDVDHNSDFYHNIFKEGIIIYERNTQ
ncbi:MAG: nucleotidyltransferase domain-containing protein [Erysipelotrichaceae bacterium]|nr:nucleotidyltransferase domain-containing protein [Erysipelotrichaceae bacterium]